LLFSQLAGLKSAVDNAPLPFTAPPIEFALPSLKIPKTDTDLEETAARIREALSRDEFSLFFQALEPVAKHGITTPFHEILLRLKAEEENMTPPGSFLAVAEQSGMLPDLDRWVVRHLTAWARVATPRQQAIYSINISSQTMLDKEFPAFVKKTLQEFGLHGSLLCFEIQETDFLELPLDAARFVSQLRPAGCLFAICGFSGRRTALDLLQRVPVNFLKIDAGLILNIHRSAIDLERVKSIHSMAKSVGISTIAECVEDDKTLEQLRLIGVEFAQGFGISPTHDLNEAETSQLSGANFELNGIDYVEMAAD
jgi:EAL domain-containing protein (putative c-di-GMP-specific phosphodiesterase class I)